MQNFPKNTQILASGDIMCVSSHKSENSIRSYASKVSSKKKREMFDTLSNKIKPTNKPGISEIVETNAQMTPNNDNDLPLKFDLVPLFPELDDDPLESNNFLELIDKIKKENQHLQTPQIPQTADTINTPQTMAANALTTLLRESLCI